ncbi:MAG: decarboxylating 6-phosphogluconate dehydrogenase [Bacillota bacterium]|nr:decarboxylating 6-phosphogluconate dehydrogenase [Bacillota bacterium]
METEDRRQEERAEGRTRKLEVQPVEIGLIGLGRMGLNMMKRLTQGGHRVTGWSPSGGKEEAVREAGGVYAESREALVAALPPPRVVWLMVPAGKAVDENLDYLLPLLTRGDLVVDGGNSNYRDSQRRAERLASAGLEFVDAGTSGGVWGLTVGYCLMVGGTAEAVARIEPVLKTLAPPDGYLHVGPVGAGHFAKMVHNGVEYGMLQAYGEGFEILQASGFNFDLRKIAHLWNQGSVVRSWLLELAERAFAENPTLDGVRGYVEDTGEGRWTVLEAIDHDVPAPVITLSLLQRFRSRQEDSFSAKVIAALRQQFGGHAMKTAE